MFAMYKLRRLNDGVKYDMLESGIRITSEFIDFSSSRSATEVLFKYVMLVMHKRRKLASKMRISLTIVPRKAEMVFFRDFFFGMFCRMFCRTAVQLANKCKNNK